MTAYLFKNICQYTYSKLRKRSCRGILIESIISISQTFITVVLIYRFLAYQRYITATDPRYTQLEIVKSTYYNESFLDMTMATGLYVALQWTRIILVFRINSFIGPLLNIIYSMIIEILKFMFIYSLLILLFWSCGRVFFSTISSFDNDLDTFATLISASLGSFDFTIFNDSAMMLSPDYGYYYLIIFLILSNIILLNFVIAILSNTYNQYKNLNLALYHIEVIKARNSFEPDDTYMSIVSLFSPLNYLFLPVIPFVIFLKNKVLNSVLLHIAYLPVMLIGTFLFFVFSMLLYPISYLALLYQNFIDIWEKGGNKKDCWIETWQFITMIFKGPFVLLFTTFADTIKFITTLYESNLKINNERSYNMSGDLSKIEINNLDTLKHILFECRNKLINIKHIIKQLCDTFEVHENLIKIIYTHEVFRTSYKINVNKEKNQQQDPDKTSNDIPIVPTAVSQEEVLHRIKQFNLCKNFIVSNSIPLEFYDNIEERKTEQSNVTSEFSDEEVSDGEDYRIPHCLIPINDRNFGKFVGNKTMNLSLDKECVEGSKTRIKPHEFDERKKSLLNCKIHISDFELLRSRIEKSKFEISNKLPIVNVKLNYESMKEYFNTQK